MMWEISIENLSTGLGLRRVWEILFWVTTKINSWLQSLGGVKSEQYATVNIHWLTTNNLLVQQGY